MSWVILILLGTIWGTSYMFIKIGVSEIPPLTFVAGRTAIAALALILFLFGRAFIKALAEVRTYLGRSNKVDREERPDLDSIYMRAVVALTGQGGWPMSMFLTPEGVPFYGGTYFPNTRRYNMPAFTDVLRAVVDAWKNRREQIKTNAIKILEAIQPSDLIETQDAPLDPHTLDQAITNIHQSFEWTNGGWGSAPKLSVGSVRALALETVSMPSPCKEFRVIATGSRFTRLESTATVVVGLYINTIERDYPAQKFRETHS